MKKALLALLISTISLYAWSQTQKVYYLKDNGMRVKKKTKADFIRTIQKSDSGAYEILEFYPNGKQKTTATASAFEPRIIYQGLMTSYSKEGQLISRINFEKGVKAGTAYYYHPNGLLQMEVEYDSSTMSGPKKAINSFEKYRMVNYLDSNGTQLVANGNGRAKQHTYTLQLLEEGDYLNGYKTGEWRGTYLRSSHTFIESYKDGEFVSGVSTDSLGNEYPYSSLQQLPEFKGGQQAFAHYLSRNLTYPRGARMNKIQGRVLVRFVVDKDGAVQDASIASSPDKLLNAEALRVIMHSPDWNPGLQRGIPVRVSYVVPLIFKLS